MALIVSELFIYPIKSLGGIALNTSKVGIRGLESDRRCMLIDLSGRYLTQRESAVMATLRIQLLKEGLKVFVLNQPEDSVLVPFIMDSNKMKYPRIAVSIWDDTCTGLVYPTAINQWFSEKIGVESKLVYMDDEVQRYVDPRFAEHGEITSYSDGYPALLLGQSSMDELNGRLAQPLPINRFRPNIVFTGGYAHQEDDIKDFIIQGVSFKGVKPCARCNIPTINQETGISNSEPTSALATYRLFNKRILFGQNVLISQPGIISVGNEIEIL